PGLVGQLLAPVGGEAEGEAAAVVRILGALDEAGADQSVDRPADRRSAAPDRGADFVESGGLAGADRVHELAPGALGAFRRAVRGPGLGKRPEPPRKGSRGRSPKHELPPKHNSEA